MRLDKKRSLLSAVLDGVEEEEVDQPGDMLARLLQERMGDSNARECDPNGPGFVYIFYDSAADDLHKGPRSLPRHFKVGCTDDLDRRLHHDLATGNPAIRQRTAFRLERSKFDAEQACHRVLKADPRVRWDTQNPHSTEWFFGDGNVIETVVRCTCEQFGASGAAGAAAPTRPYTPAPSRTRLPNPALAARARLEAPLEPSVDSKRRAAVEQLDILKIQLGELENRRPHEASAEYDAAMAEASVEHDLEFLGEAE